VGQGRDIVQARPETVQSRKNPNLLKTFKLKGEVKVVAKGTAVGHSIATGKARVLASVSQTHQFEKGEILVTEIVRLIDSNLIPQVTTHTY
jgi:pyruvate,water dikinase